MCQQNGSSFFARRTIDALDHEHTHTQDAHLHINVSADASYLLHEQNNHYQSIRMFAVTC